MSGVRRVNATDPRIPNSGGWYRATGDHTLTCNSRGCEFLLLFRGTGIKMYGKTNSLTMGALYLVLDGYTHEILLNGTVFSDGVAPIYLAENMGDGDHQLIGSVLPTNGTFLMDHFEIENASGDGFDLLSAGPTAQNVPAQAAIVDNFDPEITYSRHKSDWLDYSDGIGDYARGVSYTSTPGASLSYSFDGVAIWYYGILCIYCGSFKVSIDGSTTQRFNASNSVLLNQRMIWSNTSLDPGRHTVTLTHDDSPTTMLHLDFFRVLPGPSTSSHLPMTVTSQNLPLAVGLTLGLLVLVVVVLCGVRQIYRRRGRRLIDLDEHSLSPYIIPPIRPADQQSSIPEVRKDVLRLARPPSAPVATVDPGISSSVTGLGLPPRYETPSYDWRVDIAQ